MEEPIASLSSHQVAQLLLQLGLILVTSRLLAEAVRRLGQPAVLGELMAGILLGPTVLGGLFPAASEALFPRKEIAFKILEAISWQGMVLLLFLIGAEIDVRSLRRLGKTASTVAVFELTISLAAGALVGLALPDSAIPAQAGRTTTAAFLATALGISALPVVARILIDLGLAKRDVGVLVMGASVFDDTIGWILLAIVAGLVDPTAVGSLPTKIATTLAALVAFVLGAWFVFLPLLKRATRIVDDKFITPGSDVALYASFAFACAALTDKIGVHAVFGAFVAGALVRQVPRLRHEALERLEAVVGSVLAPVFFAFVGLKVNLLNVGSVGILVTVLAAAIVSKMLGCYVGGRIAGLSSRAALVVGAGMIARGAMGLVVAVVGLSLGVLSPELYSVIVVMAIATSLVAPPLLRWLASGLPLTEQERLRFESGAAKKTFDLRAPKVLVPTAGGPNALVAVAVAARFCRPEGATLTVLHVEHPRRPALGIGQHLDAVRKTAAQHGASAKAERVSAEDVAAAVLDAARGKDLLLIGASNQRRAIYQPPLETVLRGAPCHAVVACARAMPEDGRFKKLLVPTDGSLFSRAALELAAEYARQADADVHLVHVLAPRALDVLATGTGSDPAHEVVTAEADRVSETLRANLAPILSVLPRPAPVHVVVAADTTRAVIEHATEGGYDLLVVGAENRAIGAHLFLGHGTEALVEQAPCSTLVVIPRV